MKELCNNVHADNTRNHVIGRKLKSIQNYFIGSSSSPSCILELSHVIAKVFAVFYVS